MCWQAHDRALEDKWPLLSTTRPSWGGHDTLLGVMPATCGPCWQVLLYVRRQVKPDPREFLPTIAHRRNLNIGDEMGAQSADDWRVLGIQYTNALCQHARRASALFANLISTLHVSAKPCPD